MTVAPAPPGDPPAGPAVARQVERPRRPGSLWDERWSDWGELTTYGGISHVRPPSPAVELLHAEPAGPTGLLQRVRRWWGRLGTTP